MNARIIRDGECRMMSVEQLCAYLNLGKSKALEFGNEAGAKRKIGKRVLYDKKIIDQALDNL